MISNGKQAAAAALGCSRNLHLILFFELGIKNVLILQNTCLRSWEEMALVDLSSVSRVTN
jgi:hypothetical protein